VNVSAEVTSSTEANIRITESATSVASVLLSKVNVCARNALSDPSKVFGEVPVTMNTGDETTI
jgi:hypothetical protein